MFTFVTVLLLSAAVFSPQACGLLLGALTPLLVSVLKQPGLSTKYVRLIALAASVLVGVLTVAAAGQFNVADLLTTAALVIVACQAAYVTLWRPSGVTDVIEDSTNLPALQARHDAALDAEDEEFYDWDTEAPAYEDEPRV